MCWPTTVQIDQEVRILVTDSMSPNEILRARFRDQPQHPRALCTLLEGLALWNGKPVTAAVSVDRWTSASDRRWFSWFHRRRSRCFHQRSATRIHQ